MAKYYFTSADLINSVKRRANIPDAQDMITDEEILDFANEEMQMELVPLVLSKHEDYYLVNEIIDVEVGENRYEIPYRAVGNKLRELAYSSGSNTDNDFRELYRVSPDEVTNRFGYDNARQFHLEGNEIVLGDTDNSQRTGQLKIWYWLRPNSLVEAERVATITNIDTSTGIIEVDSIPSNFSANLEYDFIKTRSPHSVLGFDITVSAINTSTNTITLSSSDDLPSKLKVGDRIALAGESDVINLPSDLHPMLAQTVAARVLEELGDKDNLDRANQKLQKMEMRAGNLIDNRVVGSPYKVKARNGFLRRLRKRRNVL